MERHNSEDGKFLFVFLNHTSSQDYLIHLFLKIPDNFMDHILLDWF